VSAASQGAPSGSRAPTPLDAALRFALLGGVGLWVGGATTLQVLFARARRSGDPARAVAAMRDIAWVIPRVFIPASLVGVGAGAALVARSPATRLSEPRVAFPLAVYAATVVTGSVYSLPEYGRLQQLADDRGPADPELHQRLTRATWVNRAELALVCLAVAGLVTRGRA